LHYKKNIFAIVTEQNEVQNKMKKTLIIAVISLAVIFISFNVAMAKGGNAPLAHSGDVISNCPGLDSQLLTGDYDEQARGPAPHSGDGTPDGPGWDTDWPNTEKPGTGPAPNSGDGISDGSGW
jgi:hypothetical protein